MAIPTEHPWACQADDVVEALKVDPTVGLTSNEAKARQKEYGFNELEKEPPTPLWKLVLAQFDDLLVKILLLSAFVSLALAYVEEDGGGLRAYIEPGVILLILFLNAVVGVWQESNAEAALEALKAMQSETASVLRDGRMVSELPARELVPGDVVLVSVGDRVPADMRVLQLNTATLRAEQSSLTGESVAVMKQIEPIAEMDTELQSKECMLFSGTAIANGSCVGLVTSTGMKTEIGKIQAQIQEASEEESDTPLKAKINEFGEMLAKVIFIICVLVWLINYNNFLSWRTQQGSSWVPDLATVEFNVSRCTYYFKIAVALAVAAIPEGLPAVITTCLALGTKKMAAKNAIIRKLPSVETLGCTSVICSDKTGTLTTNQMSAVRLVCMAGCDAEMSEFSITGETYSPEQGEVVGLQGPHQLMRRISAVSAVCNDSRVEWRAGAYKAVGAPTEAALLVMVEKIGIAAASAPEQQAIASARERDPESAALGACAHYQAQLHKLATLEFDRNRKSMSVVARGPAGNELLVKGAAEFVLERCTHAMLQDGSRILLTPQLKAQILARVKALAERALRCLAFAEKQLVQEPLSSFQGDHSHPAQALLAIPENYEGVESGLVFLGLAGLKDPPRPEVRDSIRECRKAGVRVVVITGDNKDTAEAIASEIGLLQDHDGLSYTGREFVALPREKQAAVLQDRRGCVFSRAEPKHKQDIVRLLKELTEITAMTGDGVNDAPALKLADIGIAMGISGTEVAKEASDMVLADDNFSTIVVAVCEGRSIYNNMKAFIRYMISSNIGEVASIFITAALGLPEGLIPVQLLWVNLVTDGPPATALGFNPPDKDVMRKPPRHADEPLITPWVFFRYMVVGIYVGFATVSVFVVWYLFPSFMGIDLSEDGHSTVTWQQLSNWQECRTWEGFSASSYTAGGTVVLLSEPCDIFEKGKAKASTLSLSVLVAIEMFNALNALSEDNSLLQLPPWANPYLLLAMVVSLGLHCVILYVPFLASIFEIVPLSRNELLLVLLFSFPVIVIDEVLKFIGRNFVAPPTGDSEEDAAAKKAK